MARAVTPDDQLRKLADRQNGYFTWDQARGCGLSKNQIANRVAGHGWVKVLPRVYRQPGAPETVRTKLTAIQLWMGDDGHFTGRTAAFLFGLQGIDSPKPITIARYAGGHPGGVRLKRLRPDDRPATRWVQGCRVAGLERVLLDLAASESPTIAGQALDDALRRRLTTLDRLWEMVGEEQRGRKGVSALRQLLRGRDDRDATVRSEFETRMLRILRRIEADFIPNFRVEVASQTFFLDFYIPSARLGIECHSMGWHGPERHRADAQRHRLLVSTGLQVLYFTWDEVVLNPRQVELELRQAIAARQLLLATPP